jgi:TRAP-type C4-dicarboxylate transport system permease small subunit
MNRLYNALKWMDDALARCEGWLVVIFLWIMVIFTFVQVCLRALYTHVHIQWANVIMGYLDWTESLVRLLVLWLTFLGASLVTGENKHIKIDVFAALIPKTWLPFRELLLSVASLAVCALLFKVSILYIKIEATYGGSIFLNLPSWIGQLILPIGFFMILFHFLIRSIDLSIQILRGEEK